MSQAKEKSARQSLFGQLGGIETLNRVHKRFYDKIYVHPWLTHFFEGHEQAAIELRQTQFMAEKFGADIRYPGMALELAHRRMFISEELLTLRRELLRESRQFEVETLLVLASQEVVDRLLDEESGHLAELEEFIGKPIRLQAEALYTQEQYDIVLI